ncbi:MAG: (Fe-S)-binding protein [Thermodesulfobacteriota bacterium]
MTDNSCAKCGACTTVCPVYQVTGQESLTARGRLHLLEKIDAGKQSQAYLDIFSKCLLCDACHQACPRAINLPKKVVESRHNFAKLTGQGSFAQSLVKGCLSHQRILASIGKFLQISKPLLDKLPASSGLRLKLGLSPANHSHQIPPKKTIPEQSSPDDSLKSVLFPGCLARHLNWDITFATSALVSRKDRGSPDIPPGQACCGLAFYSSGNIEEARQLARLNIAAFAETDVPIVVVCGSCYSHLTGYPALLADDNTWSPRAIAFADRLRELSAFLTDQSPSPTASTCADNRSSVKKRVVYHDPCHLRYGKGLKEAPRQLLNSLPWVELVELANGSQCCGSGGLFNLAHPDISEQITGQLINDILAVTPDLVVTTCSGCLIQLRQQLTGVGSRTEVRHLSQVLTNTTK